MDYVPFDNRWEFLHHYVPPKSGYCLSGNGIWLKEKKTHHYHLVTELRNSGVVVGSRKLRLWGDNVFNDTTSWSELYENYTFLNNSPCGKKAQG